MVMQSGGRSCSSGGGVGGTVGIDLVHIPAFAGQLAQPGSRFEAVFSAGELRRAASACNRAEHLAGRWAAKEAFIKAWEQALFGTPPPLSPEQVVWSDIEVVADRWGRVGYCLSGSVGQAYTEGGLGLPHVSISHDGDYATAVCLIAPTSQ